MPTLPTRIYRRFFLEDPTAAAAQFFRDLGRVSAGFLVARVVAAIASILAARWLGPTEYGQVNLVITVGYLASLFMLLGVNTSVVRYGSAGEGRAQALATGVWGAVVQSVVIGAVLYFAAPFLAPLFKLPSSVFAWGCLFGLASSAYMLVASAQQALGKFGAHALAEVLFALVLLVSLVVGVRAIGPTHPAMALAYLVGYGVATTVFALPMWRDLDPRLVELGQLPRLVRYGLYGFGSGAGFFVQTHLQLLILNAHLSALEVGLYSAYLAGSLRISGQLMMMVRAVLFPKASASTNRSALWGKLRRSWLLLAAPMTLGLVISQAGILLLMGDAYTIDVRLLLLFAGSACLSMMVSTSSNIVGSVGIRGARVLLYISWGMAASNLLLTLLLVPRLRIVGAAVALFVSQALAVVAFRWLPDGLFTDGDEVPS